MPDVNVTVRPLSNAAQRAELLASLVKLAYAAFMAWQVAKAVCPQLGVHEQLFVKRLETYFRIKRKQRVTQRQADDFVASVTKHVREQEGS